jgi:hypothetical protein
MKKNRRPEGELTPDEIQRVIENSGYPLQVKVAAKLAPAFDLIEEWSYIDRTTGELRTLDLVAERRLPAQGLKRDTAGVRLLVECKRSQLPYVFFRGATESVLTEFPAIHGIRGKKVLLVSDASNTGSHFPVPLVMGLSQEPFVSAGPPVCPTFSKVVEKQDTSLDLSGEDPYKRIVLPLLSALDYSFAQQRSDDPDRCEPMLTLAVCVLSARMLVHDAISEVTRDEPWVRIVRRETPSNNGEIKRPGGIYAIDVVQVDFFDTFLSEHLLPLARTFADRAREKYEVLCRLAGSVDDLGTWSWQDVR